MHPFTNRRDDLDLTPFPPLPPALPERARSIVPDLLTFAAGFATALAVAFLRDDVAAALHWLANLISSNN